MYTSTWVDEQKSHFFDDFPSVQAIGRILTAAPAPEGRTNGNAISVSPTSSMPDITVTLDQLDYTKTAKNGCYLVSENKFYSFGALFPPHGDIG